MIAALRICSLGSTAPGKSGEIGVGAAGTRQSDVVNRGAAGAQNVVLSRCLVRPSSRKIASATTPYPAVDGTSCSPSSKTARGRCQWKLRPPFNHAELQSRALGPAQAN